jgi:hypothetical protein
VLQDNEHEFSLIFTVTVVECAMGPRNSRYKKLLFCDIHVTLEQIMNICEGTQNLYSFLIIPKVAPVYVRGGGLFLYLGIHRLTAEMGTFLVCVF